MAKTFQRNDLSGIKFERHRFMAKCSLFSVIRPKYYFISHSLCKVTPMCEKCRSFQECIQSLSEVLVFVNSSLITRPGASTYIVYNIFHNNRQLSMFRGFPLEMMIMKNKFDGELPPFSFRMTAMVNLMNENGP